MPLVAQRPLQTPLPNETPPQSWVNLPSFSRKNEKKKKKNFNFTIFKIQIFAPKSPSNIDQSAQKIFFGQILP